MSHEWIHDGRNMTAVLTGRGMFFFKKLQVGICQQPETCAAWMRLGPQLRGWNPCSFQCSHSLLRVAVLDYFGICLSHFLYFQYFLRLCSLFSPLVKSFYTDSSKCFGSTSSETLSQAARSPIFSHFSESMQGVSTIRAMQQQDRQNTLQVVNDCNATVGSLCKYHNLPTLALRF